NDEIERLQRISAHHRSTRQDRSNDLLAERRTDRPSAPPHPQSPERFPPHTQTLATAPTPAS
ncbi:MAG: hypothetical protein NW220_17895, partial [Leptolyngbyaceae cyanobacterium bins.349]|nr:hypothetical protein [Leptolyngbyaceae cyanobacterium bins.349]